jgi:hypothetical protein
LLPKVFIIDMNEKLVKWTHIYAKAITLSTTTKTTLLFAGDRVVIADSQAIIQRGVFTQKTSPQKFWNGHVTRKITDGGIFRTRPSKT